MLIKLVVAILGISFLVGLIAARLWKKDSPQWKAFPGLYTYLPALISVLLVFALEGRWSYGDFSITKLGSFHLFLGFIIPVVLYGISLAVQLRAGSLKLRTEVSWRKILPGIPVTVLVLILFVAGEEIGWRGFLQTPLLDAFGPVGGVIVLGLIWGIWHAPIALRGHNLTSDFWAETFILYPVMCVLYSFPLAFLTTQSGSIWPALVFHATNNALGSIGTQIAEPVNAKRQVAFTTVAGILVLGPFAFLL
jgi:membrane protease YdiL (CAAX protease family)